MGEGHDYPLISESFAQQLGSAVCWAVTLLAALRGSNIACGGLGIGRALGKTNWQKCRNLVRYCGLS